MHLWNQENAVNRGVQLNYAADPFTFAFSWNDGFYSNRFTWLWGSIAYALNKENTFSFVAGGNYAHTTKATLATPLFQNNETILNLIYTYNAAPWSITPYFQYTHVPAASSIGAFTDAATYGGAILANYSFGEDSPLSGVSLPIRFEYIASTGNAANGAPNLLYGPSSKAWSVTVTPTMSSPLAMRGSHRCFCSSVPPFTSARVRISGRVINDPPMPSDPHDSSSVATTIPM